MAQVKSQVDKTDKYAYNFCNALTREEAGMNRQQRNMRSVMGCAADARRSAVSMPFSYMSAVRGYTYCVFYYYMGHTKTRQWMQPKTAALA